MGRANNTSRSLQIISRAQGWDPCKIDGKDYRHLEYDDNEPMQGFKPGPPPASPEANVPSPSVPGPDTRSPGPGGQSHGKHDPYAGK